MLIPPATRVQIWQRGWLLGLVTIPALMFVLGVTIKAGAQSPAGKVSAPAPAPPKPSPIAMPTAAPWQPDEFQRAMGLGTTMPNEMPLPITSVDPPQVSEEGQLNVEDPLPIFRKPLPIVSPAKPPTQQPQKP